jgi:sugar phosphate permease
VAGVETRASASVEPPETCASIQCTWGRVIRRGSPRVPGYRTNHMSADENTRAERPPAPTAARFVVLAALCVAASVAYLCRNSIGVAESTIRAELGLSERAMGWVMSSFFLTYAVGQIPTAWFGNLVGSRRAIPVFGVAWSLATTLMSFSMGMPLLVVSRLTNGIAQAGLFPACTSTIGKWFPDTGRAFATGSLASFMSVGGAIGVAVTGVLVTRVGWRETFVGYSLLGIVFAVVFYLWFRNTPAEHSWVNEEERGLIEANQLAQADVGSSAWLSIYCSPATWWICGQQFCRGAGQIFFSSWFATYLQEARGVSVEQSGFLNSLPLLGIVSGAFIGGAVSDFVLVRTGNRRLARSGVACVSMLLCAGFVFCAYMIADPILAVVAISLGTFAAAVGGPCAYTVTIDMGGGHTAVLFATMNMVGNLGAFGFIRLVPEITEYISWDAVLALFGVLYLGAAAFWFLIDPRSTVIQQSLIASPKTTSSVGENG